MTKKRRTPDKAERIYRALFSIQRAKRVYAVPLRIWPDPRPEILAVIRRILAERG